MSSFRQPIEIKRFTDGEFVNGFWQEGAQESFMIMASVQPTTGEDLESLPEGRRTSQSLRLYTDTLLKTVHDKNPDKVTLFGNDFEVMTVEPWQNNVISHYKCVVIKID